MEALTNAGLPQTGTHVLRRSAITAWANDYQLTNNQCADLAGNSSDVVERHYRKASPVSTLLSQIAAKTSVVEQLALSEATSSAHPLRVSDRSMIEKPALPNVIDIS
jgi:hypothetical protein